MQHAHSVKEAAKLTHLQDFSFHIDYIDLLFLKAVMKKKKSCWHFFNFQLQFHVTYFVKYWTLTNGCMIRSSDCQSINVRDMRLRSIAELTRYVVIWFSHTHS